MAQRNQTLFENRTDADGVLLLAAVAHPQKSLVALPGLAIRHLVNVGIAAARATRASYAPTPCLEKLDRR